MRVFSLLVVFLFSAGVALADDQALDVTIKVLESPTDRPGAVTKNIQLPSAGAQKARESASGGEPGLDEMSREGADERKKRSAQKEQHSMKKAARDNPKKAAREDMAAGKAKQKSKARKKQG